ncbi:hypothetical protein BKA61DRAFT_581947 [Leptodontidium sp. MPI-SDFR-AT-0119]|nr:hypothetical protein BKA61DRAFT_581947 [Leptodontidium sp. MPI-SDFR-AT-0119]
MSRPQLCEQELRLEAKRFVKYRGTSEECREAEGDLPRGEDVLWEHSSAGPSNPYSAVVERSNLGNAILASEISVERLLSNPDTRNMLKFAAGYRLTCLHGRYRNRAAREILLPTDAWRTVDLYLADADPELRATLVEEYSNEEKPSDREIYRKIQQYEREGNFCFKKRWKTHLSDNGRRSLR